MRAASHFRKGEQYMHHARRVNPDRTALSVADEMSDFPVVPNAGHREAIRGMNGGIGVGGYGRVPNGQLWNRGAADIAAFTETRQEGATATMRRYFAVDSLLKQPAAITHSSYGCAAVPG
jgi:hypothetical protein